MSRTAKVFLACALGAFIGGLVALEVNQYFWWLGLVAGGLAGYFSYDFRRVLEAIPHAWQAAISWRPDKDHWRYAFKQAGYMAVLSSSLGPVFLLLGLGLMPGTSDVLGFHAVLFLAFLALLAAVTIALATAVTALLVGVPPPERRAEDLEEIRRAAVRFNPITLYLWHLPRLLVIGVWWLIGHIPAGLRVVRTFLWVFFRTIHSDERLLCAVDAALGAGVGYYFGNAAIGALAGGLIGVANYEVVSKRLLKLVPTKS